MILTVFRSRLREGDNSAYFEEAKRMAAAAQEMPGYVSHKTFLAEDGERLTLVEFASESALNAWAAHSEHRKAKANGRRSYYSEYRVQICTVQRSSSFPVR